MTKTVNDRYRRKVEWLYIWPIYKRCDRRKTKVLDVRYMQKNGVDEHDKARSSQVSEDRVGR